MPLYASEEPWLTTTPSEISGGGRRSRRMSGGRRSRRMSGGRRSRSYPMHGGAKKGSKKKSKKWSKKSSKKRSKKSKSRCRAGARKSKCPRDRKGRFKKVR